ncbi:MAG: guanylate kinase [Mycoplasmataceae bacterium]|nr:guanylate kinase [Mycoplasmataceae bacterium]
MKKKGLLIVLSGPSGVGKHTLWASLLKEKKFNLKYSISMTTRPKRFDETNGYEYFFVTRTKFKKAIDTNQMLEYAEYCNNYYGTPKKYVEDLRDNGYNILLEIEVQGGLNIKKIMEQTKDRQFVSIFILPPSTKDLIKRLRGRGTEGKEIIDHRIKQAKWEISQAKHYKYQIVNDKINVAKTKLKNILIKEMEKNVQ